MSQARGGIRNAFLQRLEQRGLAVGGSGARGASEARQRRRSRPPVLTGGESFQTIQQGAKVDWLTVTYLPEPDEHPGLCNHHELMQWIGPMFAEECAGILGYAYGVRYYVPVNGTPVLVGRCDWGGDNRQGRARLDLTGTGCAKVRDWHKVRFFVEQVQDAKITRVDLAVDCLQGEYSIDDAVGWYMAGEFNAGGRNPRHSTPGDWLNPHYGRTLEIGRRTNGKMLRAYEKGRQLGDSESPWVRFEVELRNIDRDIPTAILTDCDQYFAGAYKCLARILDAAAERIPTHQAEGEVSLAHIKHHAALGYGKLIHVLRMQMTPEQIIEELAREGVPRRLEKSALCELIEGRRHVGPHTQERQVAA